MPVTIKKKNGYEVSHGEKVSAKSTTKAKAQRQANLLHAVSHDWKPTGAKAQDMRNSTKGSKPFSNAELKRGYRIIKKRFLKEE